MYKLARETKKKKSRGGKKCSRIEPKSNTRNAAKMKLFAEFQVNGGKKLFSDWAGATEKKTRNEHTYLNEIKNERQKKPTKKN